MSLCERGIVSYRTSQEAEEHPGHRPRDKLGDPVRFGICFLKASRAIECNTRHFNAGQGIPANDVVIKYCCLARAADACIEIGHARSLFGSRLIERNGLERLTCANPIPIEH